MVYALTFPNLNRHKTLFIVVLSKIVASIQMNLIELAEL